MALVAYDNSDSSEYEEDDNEPAIVVNIIKPVKEPMKTEDNKHNGVDIEQTDTLFNQLPKPTTKKAEIVEEDDEYLHKKENTTNVQKPKTKITVPSLNDFKDVEDTIPNTKPRIASGKKSGLLSILPQPKNGISLKSTKSLIPHVLTQKPNTVKKKEISPLPIKNTKVETKVSNYSDDSDNEDIQNDFFSMNKPIEIPEIPIKVEVKTERESNVQSIPRSIESYFKPEENIQEAMQEDGIDYASTSHTDDQTVEANGDVVLDEEAILKLCGTRGKRKREEIQIVDINQKEVLAEARQMLLKGLMDDTTQRVSSSKKKGNEPTNQQKRKHQITYLAHKAKAQEAELQNQWANNRMSRRQTQSKYGF